MVQYSLEEIIKSLREEISRQRSENGDISLNTIRTVAQPTNTSPSSQEVIYTRVVSTSDRGLRFYIGRCVNESGYCLAKFRVFLHDKGFRRRCYNVIRHAITNTTRKIVRFLYKVPMLGYLVEAIVDICRLPTLLRNIRVQQRLDRTMFQEQLAQKNPPQTSLQNMERMLRDMEHLLNSKFDKTEANTFSSALQSKVDKAETEHFLQAIENKADRIELERLVAALQQKVDKNDVGDQVARIIQSKADRSDVEQVSQIIQSKADRGDVEQISRSVSASISDIVRQIKDHKYNILDQQRRLRLLLEEARKRIPEPFSAEQLKVIASEEDHLLDAMYVTFEDSFRGTREDIKERQRVYLSRLVSVGAGTREYPILDIGCGRGEWLELLKEEGYVSCGVDLNPIMANECRDRGLNVVVDDAIAYLRSQKDASFGAISCFHLIEHLEHPTLIGLIDETLRVLRKGGIAIFETPNPENLIVGACNFYLDPTHRKPLPPALLKYLFEARGFNDVEILRLHPYSLEDTSIDTNNPLFGLVTGGQDTGIIATRF